MIAPCSAIVERSRPFGRASFTFVPGTSDQPTSAQTEETQDEDHNDDEADDINDVVHLFLMIRGQKLATGRTCYRSMPVETLTQISVNTF